MISAHSAISDARNQAIHENRLPRNIQIYGARAPVHDCHDTVVWLTEATHGVRWKFEIKMLWSNVNSRLTFPGMLEGYR